MIYSFKMTIFIYQIIILNLITNQETKLKTNQGNVSSLAISPVFSIGKHYLFSGGTDCNIKVWELSSLKEIACFIGNTDCIITLAVCNNYLLSSCYDNTIRVWDLNTYQQKCILSDDIFAFKIVSDLRKNFIYTHDVRAGI